MLIPLFVIYVLGMLMAGILIQEGIRIGDMKISPRLGGLFALIWPLCIIVVFCGCVIILPYYIYQTIIKPLVLNSYDE